MWAMSYIILHYLQQGLMQHERLNLRDNLNPFEIPEERFREIYRMPPTVAINFIEEIREFVDVEVYDDPKKIPLHLEVLAVLNFLAAGSYQRRVGMDAFACVSQATVSRSIRKICRVITSRLCPVYIKFPQTASHAQAIKSNFLSEMRLPGIVGLVDGTHIALAVAPRNQEIQYLNRKGFYSLNVQLICDNDLQILNVNARYPGSCHDSHVYRSSMAFTTMQDLHRENSQTWLFGDSAYGLSRSMIVPFRNPLNENEERFNKIHSKIRNKIERCIGFLKGRWRCLSKARALHYCHEAAVDIIYACCVCHNYMISSNVPFEEDAYLDPQNEEVPINYEHDVSETSGRNFLMNYIQENNITLE